MKRIEARQSILGDLTVCIERFEYLPHTIARPVVRRETANHEDKSARYNRWLVRSAQARGGMSWRDLTTQRIDLRDAGDVAAVF